MTVGKKYLSNTDYAGSYKSSLKGFSLANLHLSKKVICDLIPGFIQTEKSIVDRNGREGEDSASRIRPSVF